MAILQRTTSFWKIIILFTIVQITAMGCRKNVVDYYNSLPQTIFDDKDLGNIKYSLSKKENTWISQSLADYEFNPVVDIQNGYIEFNDEGTGGGNVFIQVMLFKKADNSPLIGVTKGGYNGIYFESLTTFYETKNNLWIEADNVFPEIGIERFLNNKYQELYFEKDDIITPNLTALTELPQSGTTVNLNLNFSKFDFLIEANHNPINQTSFSKLEQDKLREIIDNISVESFQLNFNKTKGKFEIIDSTFLNSTEKNQIFDETYILSQVWKLKEVSNLASFIDSASNHTRGLELSFDGIAEDKPNYYLVRGVEDNGGNFVTHLIFYINKNSFKIYRYNVVNDVFKKIDQ